MNEYSFAAVPTAVARILAEKQHADGCEEEDGYAGVDGEGGVDHEEGAAEHGGDHSTSVKAGWFVS